MESAIKLSLSLLKVIITEGDYIVLERLKIFALFYCWEISPLLSDISYYISDCKITSIHLFDYKLLIKK